MPTARMARASVHPSEGYPKGNDTDAGCCIPFDPLGDAQRYTTARVSSISAQAQTKEVYTSPHRRASGRSRPIGNRIQVFSIS